MHRPAAATIILLLAIEKIRDLIDARDEDHHSTRESVSFGHLPDWLKSKNPAAPAVKREAERDFTATAASVSERLSFLQWLLLHQMGVAGFAAGRSSFDRKRSRPVRAFSATLHDGQRPSALASAPLCLIRHVG
jgi:hypothetical protein